MNMETKMNDMIEKMLNAANTLTLTEVITENGNDTFQTVEINLDTVDEIRNLGSTGSYIHFNNGEESIFVNQDVDDITTKMKQELEMYCEEDYIVLDENDEEIDTDDEDFDWEECNYNIKMLNK